MKYNIVELDEDGEYFDSYEVEAENLQEAYDEAWDNYIHGDNPTDGDDVSFEIYQDDKLLWSGRCYNGGDEDEE